MSLIPEILRPRTRVVSGAAYTLYMSSRAMYEKARGKSDDRVRELTKEWSFGIRDVLGVEVRAHGFDEIDWSAPYIIMANHQSYLDVVALYSAFPKTFGIVAKKQLFAIPFFSGVMRALGCVEVDRDKRAEAMSAMKAAGEQVRSGTSIAVFPEGTRSRGDRVAPLKKGPFYLAQAAGVPALPVGIRGTHALMPRENTKILSGVVEVYAGKPIPCPTSSSGKARAQFIATVRAEIARLAGVPMVD